MTVLTQTSKMLPQAMNGVATVFSFTFRALIAFPEAIQAIVTDTTTDTDTTLIFNDGGSDGYTVAIDTDGIGGTITVNDARSADFVITIFREYDITQESNFADYNAFPAETVESDYDKGIMVSQQLEEKLDRAILLPITVTGVSTVLPVPEANAAIGWDPTATFLVNNPENLNQVSIDLAADPDYIGATSGDGVIRTNSTMTYTDGGDFVTLGVEASGVDHDLLLNFVPDEHVLHAGVILTAGTGFTGGGNISLSRTFDVDADYAVITANDGATDITAIEMETLTDGSNADALHVHATITNDQVKVDAAATRDYIGATAADGVIRADASISVADAGDFITLSVAADYADITANDGATDVTAVELEELTDGSTTTLHTHAGIGTDEAVAIDALATPGFLGAADSDGVLRTSTPLSYTDGGDFVTITLDTTANFVSTGTWRFGTIELVDATTTITRDGANNMEFTDAVTGTKTLAELASGGGGASLVEIVSQGGHGLLVGDWVKVTGSGTYGKAQADTSANAESVGVVIAVPDVNNFTFQFGGKASIFSGLTPGAVYFLDPAVAGAVVLTTTTTEDEYVKPVMIAETATEGFVFNFRGNKVTNGTTSYYKSFDDGDLNGSDQLPLAHDLGHKFALIQVYDENDDLIYPDLVNLVDNDNALITLASFAPLTGTWRVVVLDQGNVASTTSDIFSFTSATSPGYNLGTVTHIHNLDQQYAQIVIYDNNDKIVQPGDITATDADTSTIDLTAFHPITGTWQSVARR